MLQFKRKQSVHKRKKFQKFQTKKIEIQSLISH
jgi:hypothetical protein